MTGEMQHTDGRPIASLALALVIVLAATPAAARAQDDGSELFREGVALREAGDSAGAVDRLRRAHRLDPAPRVTYNLAAALADHGRYVEARFLLRRLVSASEEDLLIHDAARALLDQVAPRVATLSIAVAGGTAGRRVVVDGGRDVGAAREIALDPGPHRVEVRAPDGTVLARSEVELEAGERADVVLRPVSAIAVARSRPAGAAPALGSVDEPARDDTWMWVGIGAGIVVVVGAVILGTALALSGQGSPAIDGDLDDIRVGDRR